MKWFLRISAALVAMSFCFVILRADLPPWAQETIAATPLEGALFRSMSLPTGSVTHLRPPWESKAHLGQLIEKSPHTSELYSLRARQDERLADFTAAEADWKQAAAESQNKLGALTELADFYERRVQAEKETATLLQLAATPEQPSEKFQPTSQQPQWHAFGRAIQVSNDALAGAPRFQEIYISWTRRYPKDVEPYQAYLDWAVAQRNRALAATQAARLKTAFPNDTQLAVTTDAKLARIENGDAAALAVYAKAFSPLWPDTLRAEYFKQLGSAHQLRVFLGEAQTQLNTDATNLDATLREFFYYEQQDHKDIADQKLLALLSARDLRKVAWNADELKTVAALLLRVADYDEAARCFYTLYQLPNASEADRQLGLASVISMLLDVPEQSLDFGNRDLSLYKNIARMDRHPGFLNGILTVALNTTSPDFQYQNASQTAVAYFHRAAASLLIDKLKNQFPRATQTAELESKLFFAYAAYGQQDAIIKAVPNWLNNNPDSPEYVHTALLLADAYASKHETKSELAIYDRLLTEIGNKSDHMPIGQAGVIVKRPNYRADDEEPTADAAPPESRFPDYSRVLDRYISRLVQLERPMDAVALFRREIDRDPDDPGIYERFALFLEQNHLESNLEQTYKDALTHFRDLSWASKLGRFYLRQEKTSAYENLARQITDTFGGSQLASFLGNVTASTPVLYRQVNVYAHKRFPDNLTFVNNLLAAYSANETVDHAAYEELLRQYWFYDDELKVLYLQHLNTAGQLSTELAKLPNVNQSVKDSNLAALEFQATGEAWLTNYEAAAPIFVRLASMIPGDPNINNRAIAVERSLGSSNSAAFDTAIKLAQQDFNIQPGNTDAVTRVGEIYADREQYAKARPWWNRVDAIHPGASAGYLSSATVFWDYFQFKDSLRVIAESRSKLGKPYLFGYEAGAIYENEGDYKQAINAYIPAALHDGSQEARNRLLTLAQRNATAAIVEAETAQLVNGPLDSAAFELRLALLEKQNRRDEIKAMLTAELSRVNTAGDIQQISTVANRLGFDSIAADCLKRTLAITNDPIEKLQTRIELARFFETHHDATAAETEFASLLKDEPNRLGIIRAAVDFYWRQKQTEMAVSTLEAAAQRSQAPYKDQLNREAAEKATNSGQYEIARRLLDVLLANDPYNGDLLAEKASTYARANNNPGLVAFYSDTLKSMQSAKLPAAEKTMRVAALRRGYILALITAQQFRDALEQYQLVLNAYPDDASLAAEVAGFADAHQLTTVLLAYYQKATVDSPRDYRWPLVLARIQTSFRHYPEAIAAYEKAAYVRPDRADLYVAKADLETRLLHFEDAIKSYAKLYELSFHDTQYLANQAELYARLNNKPEAVRLLRAAYIDGHPKEPSGYVTVLQLLNGWRMFTEETALFNELRPMLVGTSQWTAPALKLQIQALIALHRPADALTTVNDVWQNKKNDASLSTSFGQAVALYLDPAEKAAIAQQISDGKALPKALSVYGVAQAAGFTDMEAAELERRSRRATGSQWPTLNRLQSHRLLFEKLGRELEDIAPTQTAPGATEGVLAAAFSAYQKAGDNAAQLRLSEYAGSEYPRLFVRAGGDLNSRLQDLSTSQPMKADEVLQYIIVNSPSKVAAPAIAARGRSLTPLWINCYTALDALYSLTADASGNRAFDALLGPRTVGAEIAFAGDAVRDADWFYYAARYGDYLGHRKSTAAQDFLPASVEANPAASDSYVSLADNFADLNQPARASQLYREALQLSPDRADVYDRLASLAFAGNRRADAIAAWQRAFQVLAKRVETGPLPPAYWTTARGIFAHANRANAMSELKPAADQMLRAYAKRNGDYQFKPFLAGIFDHPADRAAALAWVVELSRIPRMEGILDQVLQSPDWIDAADKDPLYRAEIEQAQKAMSNAAGQAAVDLRDELNRHLTAYAQFLIAQKRWSEAWNTLQQVDPSSAASPELVLETGAFTGHLNELISRFRAQPDMAPSAEQVLAAARQLNEMGSKDLSLQLEEFEYSRQLASSGAPASAWFGMAQVRLDQKRNDEALALIRNVTLSVDAPFVNLPEAIHILEDAGLKEDAVRYALEWQTAEPWNSDAQLTFARLKAEPKLVDAIRRDTSTSYKVRVAAARVMRDLSSPVDGTDELALLTHKSIAPNEASQPFSVEARLDSAKKSVDSSLQAKLYAEAIALQPSLEEARLQLAKAALSSGKPSLGLAAFESYNRANQASAVLFEVQQLAAQAYAQRGDWGQSLNLYNELLSEEHDSAKRTTLAKARDTVAEKQALAAANLARSPAVSDKLSQSRIVKPKLKSLPAGFIAEETVSEEELQQ